MTLVDQLRTVLKDERIAVVRLHPVQECMVENIGIVVTGIVNSREVMIPFPLKKMTCGGRPMVSDLRVPEDEIWFEDRNGNVLTKLEHLELPEGYL